MPESLVNTFFSVANLKVFLFKNFLIFFLFDGGGGVNVLIIGGCHRRACQVRL